MSDISIIIPHRGNDLGLWATVTSIENEIKDSGINAEYIFITNGEKELNLDSKAVIGHVDQAGRLGYHQHYQIGVSPPMARQLGSEQAKGKYLFFFDNHCLVTKDYFKRAIYDFENYGIDLLHSTTQYYVDDPKCYHYRLKLHHDFWGEASATPLVAHKPYRIGVGGHGGFMVTRESWEDTGGYGPYNIFDGYGGEEVYCDLKYWLLGKSVWLDPYILHYHFAGNRGYKRHYYDDYFVNMMGCANMIGGEKWLNTVFESFISPGKHTRITSGPNATDMFDLYVKAQQRTDEHSKYIASRAQKSLDELLLWFRENNIAS